MQEVNMQRITELEDKAVEIRMMLLTMCQKVGVAHLGGALSLCDMAVALYYEFLKFDPKNPKWEERDRLVLSKGHTGCLIYNIFADLGMYNVEDIYKEYNKIGGRFGLHPNRKYVPGFEASTGSLGHGLSLSLGMAFAGRADKASYRVFCITGDGELDEGSNWEAIMCAAHYKLGNFVAIVDKNKVQSSDHTEIIMSIDPLDEKFRAFGWDVINVADGNDMVQIVEALSILPPVDAVTPRKPICIILNTVKGKGVDFMENDATWHIVYGLSDEKLDKARNCVAKNRKIRR